MRERLALVFLVLLRIAIGWHFLFEGLEKVHTVNVGPTETNRPWSSEHYLREAPGAGQVERLSRAAVRQARGYGRGRGEGAPGRGARRPRATTHRAAGHARRPDRGNEVVISLGPDRRAEEARPGPRTPEGLENS